MNPESKQLRQVIEYLKGEAVLPSKIDVSRIGSRFWISSYDTITSQIVSESIYSGMSNSKEVATLKALTEKVERLAAINGAHAGLPACQTDGTDGFACLPRSYPQASKRARENALNEAIERYAWATWWDEPSIAFRRHNLFSDFKNLRNYGSMVEMMAEAGFESPFCLVPSTTASDKMVIILMAPLIEGGFVSGGACGNIEDAEDTIMRGLDELFRHAMGIRKMKREGLKPTTFYERRLAYFGLGHGDDIVKRKIAATGSRPVVLPELQIDQEIPHKYDHEFVVHRCLFRNQPPFLGGPLERLCL